jgi:hypothetical protein
VQSEIQKYRGAAADPRPQRPTHKSDFARLARRICGRSIGVVLGGGGMCGIVVFFVSYVLDRCPWYISPGNIPFCLVLQIKLRRVQGVIRALEEYGIPIDHIGGRFRLDINFVKKVLTLCRHKHWSVCWWPLRTGRRYSIKCRSSQAIQQ